MIDENIRILAQDEAADLFIALNQVLATTGRQLQSITKVTARYNDVGQAAVATVKALTTEGEKLNVTVRNMGTWQQRVSVQLNQTVAQQDLANRAAQAGQRINRGNVTTLGQVTAANERASNSVREFTLSWRSLKRIIEIQILRRAVFALSNAIRNATVLAIEFSKAVAELQTISQEAQLTIQEWERGLIRLSNAFGLDVLDVAEAAYQTLSNQVAEGAETFEFLEQAIRFGITTQATATESVQLLTAAINAYGLSAKDVGAVAATFFKTIELGRIRAGELANTFGRIAILGSQLGIELEELQAAMTVLTRRGVKSSEALTQLRGFLLKLLKPTTEMKKLFKDLGIESGEAAIQAFGFAGFLRILEARTAGSSTELAKFVSRIRGLIAAIGLTNEGLEAFNKDLDQIKDATVSYEKAATIAFTNVGRNANKIFQELKNLILVDFGQSILETIVSIDNTFIRLTTILNSLVRAIKALAIGAVARFLIPQLIRLGTAIRGTNANLLTMQARLKATGKTARLTATQWVFLAAIIGEAVAAAIESWSDQQDRAAESWRDFQKEIRRIAKLEVEQSGLIFDQALRGIKAQFAAAAAEVAKTTKNIGEAFEEQIKLTDKAADAFADVYKDSEGVIKDVIDSIVDAQKEALKDVEQLGKFLKDFRKDIEETIFERELELAPNIDEQFTLIERRIAGLDQQLSEALKTSNVELIQSLFREIATFEIELVELDRKTVKRRIKIEKELLLNRQQARSKDEELQKRVEEAFQRRNFQRVNRIGRQRIELVQDLRDEEIKLNAELEKLQSDRAGKFSQQFETRLMGLLQRAEEELAQVQGNLLVKILAAEDEKLRVQLRNAILIAEISDIRRDRPDEEFFKRGAEEINRLFAERTTLISQTAQNLRELGQEQTAKRLEEQLAQERIKVNLQLSLKSEAKRLNIIGEELNTITKISDAIKEQSRGQQQIIAEAKNISRAFLIQQTIAEQLTRFTKISFALGVDAEQLKLHIEAARGTIEPLTESLQIFIKTGQRTDNIIALIEELRKRTKKLGITFDNTTDQQLRAINQIIQGNNTQEKSVGQIIDEEVKLKQELTNLIQTVTAFGTENTNAAEDTVESLDAILERIRLLRIGYENLARAQNIVVQAPGVEPHARGGHISSSDRIPALLSPGEFVINARSSRKFYSQLVGMNSGMARGGAVSNTTIGDIHIHGFKPSGSEATDVIRLGKRLRREVRRGTVRLS